jgi:hypothetical protein
MVPPILVIDFFKMLIRVGVNSISTIGMQNKRPLKGLIDRVEESDWLLNLGASREEVLGL